MKLAELRHLSSLLNESELKLSSSVLYTDAEEGDRAPALFCSHGTRCHRGGAAGERPGGGSQGQERDCAGGWRLHFPVSVARSPPELILKVKATFD